MSRTRPLSTYSLSLEETTALKFMAEAEEVSASALIGRLIMEYYRQRYAEVTPLREKESVR